MNVIKEILTETASIRKLEKGIIRIAIKDNAHLTAENLEENFKAYVELMDEETAPFLILVNDSASIDSAGREEYNKKTRREVRAKDALVIKSPATMLLINSQVKFIKPIIPTQAFLDEASAIRWLVS
ncbi:MAG TPA: hypothetical protein DCX54_04815 [Flavobacteriales bacterium]|nr:hypothetical protein [Flavobacteriales bacterium]